ncbi:hypothetical protein AEAC466_19355 [Asticcacaulis sp. AC466]|uniref:hypothetical protein n=1 Tax=Asticcacaulis sp. AC466 TaxID=1282362 RepID=UPI0003C3F979|nr:hypothetical protein [Asticcacaulis sp. AC466]ESQ82076.1 hypothetical protein AEAC466_19355 [Asticcacaulis sp. AC466]
MKRPLLCLETLKSWKGLDAFYKAFEARGYAAHRCHIDLVRASDPGSEWQDSLMLYWEELAKETLSSGWISGVRGENLPGFYRSPFLDFIEASEKPNQSLGEKRVTVHPLVASYNARRSAALRGGTSPEAPKYFDPQARVKVAEYNRMGVSATDWDGKANAFAAIFREKAEAAGFERGKPVELFGGIINRLWFRRPGPDGCFFCIGYQKIGPRGMSWCLPLEFWISSADSPGERRELDLQTVIPGLRNYLLFGRVLYPMAYYADTEEMAKCATIGIQAVVTAYAILIESLSW